ncbi:MAG: SdpI family protein [Ignavibacteriales bacterium]
MHNDGSEKYILDWHTLKSDWPLWLVMAGMLAAAFFIYPNLPAEVPRHWNIHGEVDGYWPGLYGAFFAPLLAVGLYVLLVVTPLFDPRRDNYVRFSGAYRFLRWSLVLFTVLMYGISIMAALGYAIRIDMLVKAGVAILFIIIGNFMGQFRPNYFVGIKTPWTLSSEEVWTSTHRTGARIWVLGGLICLATAPVREVWGFWIFLIVVAIMSIVPIIYSYILYKRISKN